MAIWSLTSYYIEYPNGLNNNATPEHENAFKLFDDDQMKVLPGMYTGEQVIEMLKGKDNAPANLYVDDNVISVGIRCSRDSMISKGFGYHFQSEEVYIKSLEHSNNLGYYDYLCPIPNAIVICKDSKQRDSLLDWLYNLRNTIEYPTNVSDYILYVPLADYWGDYKTGASIRRICIGSCKETAICVSITGEISAYAMDEFIQSADDEWNAVKDRFNVNNVAVRNGALGQYWGESAVPSEYFGIQELPISKFSESIANKIIRISADRDFGRLIDRGWYIADDGTICIDSRREKVNVYIKHHPYRELQIAPIIKDNNGKITINRCSIVENLGDFVVLSGPAFMKGFIIRATGRVILPNTLEELTWGSPIHITGTSKLDLSNTKIHKVTGGIACDANEVTFPESMYFEVERNKKHSLVFSNVQDLVLPDMMVCIPLSSMECDSLRRLVLPRRKMPMRYYVDAPMKAYEKFSTNCFALEEIWATKENIEVARHIVSCINKSRKHNKVELVVVREKGNTSR